MNEIVIIDGFSASHALLMKEGTEPAHVHYWTVRAKFADGSNIAETATKAVSEAICPLSDIHMNDLPTFKHQNPSAELIARYLYSAIAKKIDGAPIRLTKISVQEEPGCWAGFIGEKEGD